MDRRISQSVQRALPQHSIAHRPPDCESLRLRVYGRSAVVTSRNLGNHGKLRLSCAAVGLLLLAFGGCRSASDLRLDYRDLKTIDRIYASSSSTLKNVSTEVRVLGDGAVEIVKRGYEVRKRVDEDDGALWLPVVLVRELPEYYESRGGPAGRGVELEAYRLDGGLWCIAAVEEPSPQGGLDRSDSEQADGEGIHVVLYSREFVSKLPFLVPAEPNGTLSNISISLPAKSRFYSTEVDGQVQPRDSFSAREPRGPRQRQTMLTELPPSVAQGVVKAAGQLDAADVIAWNFSGVSFSVPGGIWRLRPWFLPSALCAVLAVMAVLFWYFPVVRGNTRVDLESAAIFRIRSAVIETLQSDEAASASGYPGELDFLERSTILLLQLRKALEVADVPRASFLVAEIEDAAFIWIDGRPSNSYVNLRAAHLREIVASYRKFLRIEDAQRYMKRRAELRQLGWLLAILALACAIWFMATLASGQTASPPPPSRAAALAEMKVLVTPHDPHSTDRDKVDVRLRFYALTETQNSGVAEIGIDSGANFTMSAFPRTSDSSQATVLQQTDRSLRLAVHASHSSAIRRLRVLANGVTSFVPSKVYLKSLEKADRVEIKYTVEGSQKLKDRGTSDRLHLFPFDSVAIEVPLGFDEFALLSQVELEKDPELEGDVWLDGPNIPFEENQERTRYRIAADDDSHRIPVWPGKGLRVMATFERKPLQKYGLTAGMVFIAVLVGLLVGKLMSMKDSAAIQILVGALGILGLPLTVRALVFDHYKDLPTFVTGGITVFECVFMLSVVVLAIVSFAARRWFK